MNLLITFVRNELDRQIIKKVLAYIAEAHCELISRRRNSYRSKSFGPLRDSLAQLKVRNAVIVAIAISWAHQSFGVSR